MIRRAAGTPDSMTVGRALPGRNLRLVLPVRHSRGGRRTAERRPPPPPVSGRRGVGTRGGGPAAGAGGPRTRGGGRLGADRLEARPHDRAHSRSASGSRSASRKPTASLVVTFYGAVGDVDWMRYGAADTLVRRMSWRQVRGRRGALTFELARPVWGYRARWDRSDLLLDIRRPPGDRRRAIRCAGGSSPLIPVHPPGGASGPTGLREAEANLAVALELRAAAAGRGRARAHDPRRGHRGGSLAPGDTGRAGRCRRAGFDSQQRAAGRDQSVRQQWHQRLLQPAAQRAPGAGDSGGAAAPAGAPRPRRGPRATWRSCAAPGCPRCSRRDCS